MRYAALVGEQTRWHDAGWWGGAGWTVGDHHPRVWCAWGTSAFWRAVRALMTGRRQSPQLDVRAAVVEHISIIDRRFTKGVGRKFYYNPPNIKPKKFGGLGSVSRRKTLI